MKELHRNIVKIGIVLLCCFLLIAGYYIYEFTRYSKRWINSSYNGRLNDLRETTVPGGIYDANHVELAGVSSGKRSYPDDEKLRLATSHVIGDEYGFCATGVETIQGLTLLNYDENIYEYVMRNIAADVRSGEDISLTIDSRLNIKAMDIMGKNTGTMVLIDYTTGDILCMLSAPQFDPKTIDPSLDDGGTMGDMLVNRAIQGQYIPGSIFKIITAASALENAELWENLVFNCEGELSTGGREVPCTKEHGEIDLIEAFSFSCNSTFAQIGMEVGYLKLMRQAKLAGFNKDFIFDDIILYSSSINLKKSSKNEDIAFAAIGQHEDVVTPLHIALISGAIANDGIMMEPRLIKRIGGNIVDNKSIAMQAFNSTTAQSIGKMMYMTVEVGTAKKAGIDGIRLCGKTGTAEVSSDEYMPPHSWFTG